MWLEDESSHSFRVFLFQGHTKNLKRPQSRGMNFPDTTTVNRRHLHKTAGVKAETEPHGDALPEEAQRGWGSSAGPEAHGNSLESSLAPTSAPRQEQAPSKARMKRCSAQASPSLQHASGWVSSQFWTSMNYCTVQERETSYARKCPCTADILKYEGSQIERKRDRYRNT